MPASVPYPSFTPNTVIASDEVNANFQAIVDFLNTQAINADGSVSFTAIPNLPASDPVGANQATRKAYVDAKFAAITVPLVKGGLAVVNSDGNGEVTIPHGFPGATPPTGCSLTLRLTGPTFGGVNLSQFANVVVLSVNNTNINARIYDARNGSSFANLNGWGVYWVATRS